MRRWLFVTIVALIASAVPAASQNRQQLQGSATKGTIQGLVVRAGTSQPLKGVRISLQRSAQQGQQPALSPVVTDAAGRFVVTGVEAGQYHITAERDGYVRQEFGQRRPTGSGTLVNVAAGQQITLNFSLLPAGVISGRAFNEDNEPVPRLTVQAYTYRYNDGKRSLAPVGNTQTNDLGEYRIFWLSPGEYFVSVLTPNPAAGPGVVNAAEQFIRAFDRSGSLPEIYFPGTLDPESAAPLALAAASELRGIDFSIRPIATVKVRGRVTSPVALPSGAPGAAGGAGRPGPGAPIQLTLTRASSAGSPLGLPAAPFGPAATRVNPDGMFELNNVVPGSYLLTAIARVPPSGEYVARTRLEVGNADINNVNLALSPGVAIQGRLQVEQPAPDGFKISQLRVQLNSTDGLPMNRNASVQDDGTFKLESVPAGDYRVFISNVRPGWYLESGRAGSQDAVNGLITVSVGQDLAMQLQLGFTTGSVSGSVVDQKGDRFPGALAALVPEGPRRGRPNAYFATQTDQEGKFNFNAVPPGNYKLFAWEEIPTGAYQDPVYLRRFEDRGRPVRVEKNANATVDVPVIPATD